MTISRRARLAFRPMLDSLPSRLTPGTYPAIGVMPSDPMGTDTPTWDTPVQILTQPTSTDTTTLTTCSSGTLVASSPTSITTTVL
jgi:hypothetical protein